MNCGKLLDKVNEQENMSLLVQIQVGLHLLFCQSCAREIERLEVCRDVLHNDFFPASPGLEDTVMAMIAAGESETEDAWEAAAPGGFSTRGWVVTGLVMLVSLATAFVGLDFNKIALAAGESFMLPIGIIFGIVLTSYGALFIGSHLKELAERFGLQE